uniref:BAT2 N-terminal domain-containing protein n=1 Tax=Spongospora subterranea TaxID=70186 RepID=A0A0H5QV16_9EUKA|eukprot:CRZ05421.1 hypothetical protein [Spongospora subterranea]
MSGGSRTITRKVVPRPCNIPSMRKSSSGQDPNVEIVPSGGGGWAKPKLTAVPIADKSIDTKLQTTWTVPLTTPEEPKPAVPPARPTVRNPFGVEIEADSWDREVSPPPPTTRSWVDVDDNMDFSKPVVFDSEPIATLPTSQYSNQRNPCSDTAWRPATLRKPTVQSILKKSDAVNRTDPPSDAVVETRNDIPALDNQSKPADAAKGSEVDQAECMKAKALAAVARRQEEERKKEEERKARLALKLQEMDQRRGVQQNHNDAPITVMQRPKSSEASADMNENEAKQAQLGSYGSQDIRHVPIVVPERPNATQIRNSVCETRPRERSLSDNDFRRRQTQPNALVPSTRTNPAHERKRGSVHPPKSGTAAPAIPGSIPGSPSTRSNPVNTPKMIQICPNKPLSGPEHLNVLGRQTGEGDSCSGRRVGPSSTRASSSTGEKSSSAQNGPSFKLLVSESNTSNVWTQRKSLPNAAVSLDLPLPSRTYSRPVVAAVNLISTTATNEIQQFQDNHGRDQRDATESQDWSSEAMQLDNSSVFSQGAHVPNSNLVKSSDNHHSTPVHHFRRKGPMRPTDNVASNVSYPRRWDNTPVVIDDSHASQWSAASPVAAASDRVHATPIRPGQQHKIVSHPPRPQMRSDHNASLLSRQQTLSAASPKSPSFALARRLITETLGAVPVPSISSAWAAPAVPPSADDLPGTEAVIPVCASEPTQSELVHSSPSKSATAPDASSQDRQSRNQGFRKGRSGRKAQYRAVKPEGHSTQVVNSKPVQSRDQKSPVPDRAMTSSKRGPHASRRGRYVVRSAPAAPGQS